MSNKQITEAEVTAGAVIMTRTESANRNAKDSVFCDLFAHKEYLLRLYRELHPEDDEISEDDLILVTLERVITRGQYNDLGFLARDRFVILVEAQSTWSPNIAVRMLFYLADTYRRQIAATKQNLYGSSAVNLPAPELYVIYTGNRKRIPEQLSFRNDILNGRDSAVEVCVKVVAKTNDVGSSEGILKEYMTFAHAFDEMRAIHGNTIEAIEAAIDSCIGRGILREYLIERREEVIGMMIHLLDREEAMEAYRREIEAEAQEKGYKSGHEKGLEEGRAEGREEMLIDMLRSIIANIPLSPELAMDALKIPEDDRKELLVKLQQPNENNPE